MKKTILSAAAWLMLPLLAACSRMSEEAKTYRSNFVAACVTQTKNKTDAEKRCTCVHDQIMKQYPDEAAWLSALKHYERSGGKDPEFVKHRKAAVQHCASK